MKAAWLAAGVDRRRVPCGRGDYGRGVPGVNGRMGPAGRLSPRPAVLETGREPRREAPGPAVHVDRRLTRSTRTAPRGPSSASIHSRARCAPAQPLPPPKAGRRAALRAMGPRPATVRADTGPGGGHRAAPPTARHAGAPCSGKADPTGSAKTVIPQASEGTGAPRARRAEASRPPGAPVVALAGRHHQPGAGPGSRRGPDERRRSTRRGHPRGRRPGGEGSLAARPADARGAAFGPGHAARRTLARTPATERPGRRTRLPGPDSAKRVSGTASSTAPTSSRRSAPAARSARA